MLRLVAIRARHLFRMGSSRGGRLCMQKRAVQTSPDGV